MSLRSRIGEVRAQIGSSFHRRTVPLGSLGPIITFTFDDFPRSALTVGGAIIERFGARATYYVAMGLMGTSNNLGEQFQRADLNVLIERGHELGSHTFGHLSARKTPVSAFLRDVEHCEEAIRQNIPVGPSSDFAYPYGEVTLRAKKSLGPRMASCRGTFGGFNGPDVDLNLLRANRLYGGVDQAESAKRLICENERRRSWLVFYSHDVANNPSPFGCTPALLEEVVSFAANRGARMMMVADVVSEICGRA
jgi:peptidoglycan/xylan/chitin deacetylase (PgdA/CDA1 family)